MKRYNYLIIYLFLTGGAGLSAQLASNEGAVGQAGSTLLPGAAFKPNGDHKQDGSQQLRSYLQLAVQNNPTVQQSLSEYTAALKRIPQVGGLPDPELNLGILPVAMELPAGKQIADIQLMQQLPLFGVLKEATNEQRFMAEVSYENVRQVCLDLYYTVEKQYWELYRNRQQLNIIGQKLENLRQRIRLKNSRIQSGLSLTESTMADLYTLQAAEAELLQSQTSLDDAFRNQVQAFSYLLNLPSGEAVVLPDTLMGSGLSLTALNDSLLIQHPMLKMVQLEREALKSRRRMNVRMGYPMIGVGLRYSVMSKSNMSTNSMNGKDMLMPMVSVSLPIYRKKYRSQVEETASLQKAAEFKQISVLNALKTDLNQAGFELRDAKRKLYLSTVRKQLAVQTKQERLRQYAVSQIGISDLLMVSDLLFDIDLDLLNATVDGRIAEARIRQLLAIGSPY